MAPRERMLRWTHSMLICATARRGENHARPRAAASGSAKKRHPLVASTRQQNAPDAAAASKAAVVLCSHEEESVPHDSFLAKLEAAECMPVTPKNERKRVWSGAQPCLLRP